MLLEIILQKSTVKLVLKKNDEIITETSWDADFSLSEKLLGEIDALLEKAGVSKKDVKRAVAVCDEQSSVTSARIVQTVAEAWNAAR